MKNQIKTILLLGVLSAMLVGIGAAISPTWLYIAGFLAAAMNLGAYFFSDKIVLRMHGARELLPGQAPALHSMVAELSARAGIPQPRLFLIPEMQPNAFATGRNPAHGVVAVTEGIVQLLSERELRGVIAHELAHIKNRDILLSTVAAMLAAVISGVGNMLAFSSLLGGAQDEEEGSSGLGGLAMALLAPLAATFVQLAISRSREYLADETGAEISGDPEALASALLKLERSAELVPAQVQPATASLFIVNPLSSAAGAMLRLFSTHPATEERVRRLMTLARRSSPPAPRRTFRPNYGWL